MERAKNKVFFLIHENAQKGSNISEQFFNVVYRGRVVQKLGVEFHSMHTRRRNREQLVISKKNYGNATWGSRTNFQPTFSDFPTPIYPTRFFFLTHLTTDGRTMYQYVTRLQHSIAYSEKFQLKHTMYET